MTTPGSRASSAGLSSCSRMIAGAADHMPQDALVQDVPQYRRVLSAEDGLALEAGADRAVDGRAGVLRLARADDRPGVVLALQQAGDDAHLPFVDSDGGGFQLDDRGEVRGPDLAGDQVAHGGEGAGVRKIVSQR